MGKLGRSQRQGREARHNKALTGDDLRDFVSGKLFPYLHDFKKRASGPNTIEYKIGEIFGEIKNKIQSGYNLREIIDHIDELRFRSQTEKHELSHLYEAKIKNMGNAGRNGGEYYTPRPLIRAIVQVVKPRIGDRIYGGRLGGIFVRVVRMFYQIIWSLQAIRFKAADSIDDPAWRLPYPRKRNPESQY